jgi:energy-coupling factor transport system ATP-binding protein
MLIRSGCVELGVEALSLYKIQNIIYYYPETERPALDGVSLSIQEGDFVLVAGESGSGKSSLARVLAGLLPDFYGGRFGGNIFFKGSDIRVADRRKLAREVGMVFQDPEKQLVMNSVEAEVAFGLENLGLPQPEMFRRVAEVTGFLGLTSIKSKGIATLSGGQKQKLALASVLAMQPSVLILDEPTSQLDPVSAEELLNLVKRLNEELGFTIVLIEQRLERCFHLADRVLLMESGKIIQDGSPEHAARWAVKKGLPLAPPVSRLFASLGFAEVPVTIKDARKQLKLLLGGRAAPDGGPLRHDDCAAGPPGGDLLEARGLWYTYENGLEALQNVSLRIKPAEFVIILGENGAGKSSLLKNMVGLLRPGRGKVLFKGRDLFDNREKLWGRHVAYLSQNPNDYLYKETVEEELLFTLNNLSIKDDGIVDELLVKLGIDHCRHRQPRDLSGGERQRVALAAVMVTRPDMLLLDEPTRGMDFRLKEELGKFLAAMTASGTTVVMVTHDVEFASEYATRIILMYAGAVACDGSPVEVLGKSFFYAPQAGKLCRGLYPGVITASGAAEKIRMQLASVSSRPDGLSEEG